MKRLLGLLKKEWQVQYKWLFTTGILSILLTVVIPFLIDKYVDSTINQANAIFAIASILSFLTFLIVCIQFVKNLNQELRHTDIWLHSTAPFYQLIGAKLLFSIFSNLILVFVMTIVMVITVMSKSQLTFLQDIKFMVAINYIAFISIIFVLPLALVLYTCFLKLKKRLGKFAIILVFILLTFISYLFVKISTSDLYDKFFLQGPTTSEWIVNSIQPISKIFDTVFIMDDIYLREDILSLLVTLFIIIFGIKWYEKVVKE
ncbi:hypothetical protein [Rummeliibacillus pycnus]|uniref:hypothetical protein n=1 Tax=Rummeliibacillus pycnus TaxID=101070 RepID=UPI003D2A110D